MWEYVTRAVVLEKKPVGERDVRVALFTEKLGKVEARARGARRITSKLSAHVEPGNVALVRIVENKGTHLADALKTARAPLSLPDCLALNQLLAPHQKDAALWGLLTGGRFEWGRALAALGWERKHAKCAACGALPVRAFYVPRQEFYCAWCAASLEVPENEVLYV